MLWVIPFDSIMLPFGGPVDVTLDRPFLVCSWRRSGCSAERGPRDRGRADQPDPLGLRRPSPLIAVLSVLANSETLVRVGELELAIKQLALLASYGVFFALAASIIGPRGREDDHSDARPRLPHRDRR